MIQAEVRDAISELVGAIRSTDASRTYIETQSEYSTNQELAQLRLRYAQMIQDFQRKQEDGDYTQEDIDAVREIQMQVNSHPAAQAVIEAKQQLQGLLRECNQSMSRILGMDFAQIAAVNSGCGCGDGCGSC
ncbi:MAG: YlbF family regulator [Spirochaeta sp.]